MFEVAGSIRVGSSVSDSVYIASKEIKWRGDGTAHFSIFNESSTFSIRNTSTNDAMGTVGTSVLSITSGNNVGIGTTNPLAKLHVNGSFYAPGSIIQVKLQKINTNTVINTTSFQNTVISCTITPKFSTSILLARANVSFTRGGNECGIFFQLRRDTIVDTDTVGSVNNSHAFVYSSGTVSDFRSKIPLETTYAANNINATTISVYAAKHTSGDAVSIGSSFTYGRSEITIFEVAV